MSAIASIFRTEQKNELADFLYSPSEGVGVGVGVSSGDGDGFGVGFGVGGGVGVGVAKPVLTLTRTIWPVLTIVPMPGDWSLIRLASNRGLVARPVTFIRKPASSKTSIASDSDLPVTSGTSTERPRNVMYITKNAQPKKITASNAILSNRLKTRLEPSRELKRNALQENQSLVIELK